MQDSSLLLSQSSLPSFPKSQLLLRLSYAISTKKGPNLDPISGFLLDLSPNA